MAYARTRGNSMKVDDGVNRKGDDPLGKMNYEDRQFFEDYKSKQRESV